LSVAGTTTTSSRIKSSQQPSNEQPQVLANRLKNALKNLRQGKAAFFKNYQRDPTRNSPQLSSKDKQISIQISRAKRLAALGHISRATQSLKPDKIVDASLPVRQEQFRNLCPTQNTELPALPREAPSILLQDLEGPQDSFFKVFKKIDNGAAAGIDISESLWPKCFSKRMAGSHWSRMGYPIPVQGFGSQVLTEHNDPAE